MDFGYSASEQAFAEEVRAFLRAHPPDTFPPDGTDAGYGSGLREVELVFLDDLDKARPTVVYCKGGYRSSIAAGILQREGFTDVSNARGGFDAWKEAGLAFEKPTVAAH